MHASWSVVEIGEAHCPGMGYAYGNEIGEAYGTDIGCGHECRWTYCVLLLCAATVDQLLLRMNTYFDK
eukprot:1455832-Rhodomonas_salina.1